MAPPPRPPINAPAAGEPSAPPISAPPPAPIAAPANVSFARGLPKQPVIVIRANGLANVIVAAREIREALAMSACLEFIFNPRKRIHYEIRTRSHSVARRFLT